MRILCPIHGSQPVMHISPDLWAAPALADEDFGGVRLIYEFDGQFIEAFLLSEAFACSHNVRAGTVPLPEEYPSWAKEVVSVCKQCFHGKRQLSFNT